MTKDGSFAQLVQAYFEKHTGLKWADKRVCVSPSNINFSIRCTVLLDIHHSLVPGMSGPCTEQFMIAECMHCQAHSDRQWLFTLKT